MLVTFGGVSWSEVLAGRQKSGSEYEALIVFPFSSVTDVSTPPLQSHIIERERLSGSLREVAKEFPHELAE